MARRPESAISFQMPRILPGVRALLIALAVISIGVDAVNAWGPASAGEHLRNLVILHPADLWRGRVWELFTFTFFEPEPLWLLINGYMLWSFGTSLEQRWGTRRFLGFYFATTTLAGAAAALLSFAIHSLGTYPAAGAWTALEAIAAGFALTYSTAQIRLMMVLPIQARLLIPITLGMMLLSVLMTGQVLPYVVPVLALGAAVLLHNARGPRSLILRLRVLWIERKMRSRKLHVVPGLRSDGKLPAPRSGSRGSDEFLH